MVDARKSKAPRGVWQHKQAFWIHLFFFLLRMIVTGYVVYVRLRRIQATTTTVCLDIPRSFEGPRKDLVKTFVFCYLSCKPLRSVFNSTEEILLSDQLINFHVEVKLIFLLSL